MIIPCQRCQQGLRPDLKPPPRSPLWPWSRDVAAGVWPMVWWTIWVKKSAASSCGQATNCPPSRPSCRCMASAAPWCVRPCPSCRRRVWSKHTTAWAPLCCSPALQACSAWKARTSLPRWMCWRCWSCVSASRLKQQGWPLCATPTSSCGHCAMRWMISRPTWPQGATRSSPICGFIWLLPKPRATLISPTSWATWGQG